MIIVPFWNNNVPSELRMILTVYKYIFFRYFPIFGEIKKSEWCCHHI